MEKIIKANKLKGTISDTRSFIVFSRSKEDKWIDITREIYNYMDKSFFIGVTNDYNKDCGWYVKYKDIKPLLTNIYNKILQQDNYECMAYMMNNYNQIIECVNLEIDGDLPTLKKCNIDNCIFNIDNNCCNANQEYITINNLLECDRFIQSNYYEELNDVMRQAKNKISTMNLDELKEFYLNS